MEGMDREGCEVAVKKWGSVSPDIAYSGNCGKFYEDTME